MTQDKAEGFQVITFRMSRDAIETLNVAVKLFAKQHGLKKSEARSEFIRRAIASQASRMIGSPN